MRFIRKIALGSKVVKDMVASEGLIGFTAKSMSRLFKYIYSKCWKNPEFKFNGRNYKYFYSFFNVTFTNERAVEIPIALEVIKSSLKKEILEVGNVLHFYSDFKHDVVDKYELGQNIINQDIVEYKTAKRYDLIVSVSTLEHIGWDEDPKDKNKIPKALDNMKNLLAENGEMLFTFPFGYNTDLDYLIKKRGLEFTEIYFLKRISQDNTWKQVEFSEIEDARYGLPYPFANAIVIGIIKK